MLSFPTYSVLMSVYDGEKPENLDAAIQSMFDQSVPSDDFLLVCDGPMTDGLETVIASYREKERNSFRVLRISRKGGLGRALRAGLPHCRHELVARMDSDDLSLPDRCEKELTEFILNPNLDLLSGAVQEFVGDPEKVVGYRKLPETERQIIRFSRRRNPMNHPAVMFRKSAVLAAGSYRSRYPKFEDYDLWVRMLMRGCHAANLREPLVNMRISPDLYRRRGGAAYLTGLLRFHTDLLLSGWEKPADYFFAVIPHAVVCALPNPVRKRIYQLIHQ